MSIGATLPLTLRTIPEWLKDTPLAVSLREGDLANGEKEEEFKVPVKYYMPDAYLPNITTEKDVRRMLQVMHYWGELEKVPWVVLDNVMNEQFTPLKI